jgi:hypothetical protein
MTDTEEISSFFNKTLEIHPEYFHYGREKYLRVPYALVPKTESIFLNDQCIFEGYHEENYRGYAFHTNKTGLINMQANNKFHSAKCNCLK